MYLAILWHHHQPIYRDAKTGRYLLPYVNYHLTKNYYQMGVLAEESGFPCVFNLVPCLVDQVIEYTSGKARDPFQVALEKDPATLAEVETSLLQRFLPRSGPDLGQEAIQVQVLQSLFSPLVQAPQEKDSLLHLQREIGSQVLPLYKRLWLEGRVELTTSPYYHPLLPLLFDLAVGAEPLMPTLPFQYPGDGQAQIEKGKEYFKSIFERYPEGFWPPEGAISPDVARAIAQAGFAYAVTDENVLWKSLARGPDPAALSRPYRFEDLVIFFRDRELSDLLSFEYQRWDEKDAVRHFLNKLDGRMASTSEEALVVVALDGENPWAGYKDNGVPFLREFYQQVKQKEALQPILLKDYLALGPRLDEIPLVPGTWLGNFSQWVGHPAKNAAWEKLARARQACGPTEDIFVAEGSDWFWWAGEEHPPEFDALFDGYLDRAQQRARKEPGHV